MKWQLVLFLSIAIILLGILGGIGYYNQKSPDHTPTLEQYTTDTDNLKKICDRFLVESDAASMHKSALSLQLSRSINCKEFNGECKAFYEFLTVAMHVSENDQLVSDWLLVLRKKYENVMYLIEDGKNKLRNQR
jgi:hypothetical protein